MPESKPGAQNRLVAVQLPLAVDGGYTYDSGELAGGLTPGDFVRVPIGKREETGIVWEIEATAPDLEPTKIRKIIARLDVPPLNGAMMRFIDGVAQYNMALSGMVLRMVLSSEDALNPPKPVRGVRLRDDADTGNLRITHARQRVLDAAIGGLAWNRQALAETAGVSIGVIDGLSEAGILENVSLRPEPVAQIPDPFYGQVDLTAAQHAASEQILAGLEDGYSTTLIDGVTGSGKTQVYFEAIAAILASGQQALILLPEIALTAQFLERFEARFGVRPAEWHSDLTPARRRDTWRAVHRGEIRVVAGARSALFLPFSELGLIVVDEEHDPAYKQIDRVSYHARDMAILRGFTGNFPVLLASATPSIETQVNVDSRKYQSVDLPARFGGQPFPDIELVDLKATPPEPGRWLAPPLVAAINGVLDEGRQSLLFLNRRGYAPLTLCRKCGHRFNCPDCSSWLVSHRFRRILQCHHCNYVVPEPAACPDCGEANSLVACGPGVERVVEEVAERFPGARAMVLSSDLIRSNADMRAKFERIETGDVDIIVGTQLIAKGHHFPHLKLVGVVDADLGLGQGDLRASERTFQLLHQVVGRAGRENEPGIGYLQTHLPDHPVMQAMASGDTAQFYEHEIAARKVINMPPFGRLASLVVSGRQRHMVEAFAQRLARTAPSTEGVRVLGPADAPMGMVRGRHRMRLLVKAKREFELQRYLRKWMHLAGTPKGGVRLAIDIDPQSFL